jgi:hypothetical protein
VTPPFLKTEDEHGRGYIHRLVVATWVSIIELTGTSAAVNHDSPWRDPGYPNAAAECPTARSTRSSAKLVKGQQFDLLITLDMTRLVLWPCAEGLVGVCDSTRPTPSP